MSPHIDFDSINTAALRSARPLLESLLPGGKFRSLEYVVKNPRRTDEQPGSFSINYKTGVWKDFATNDGGSDLISLVAYLEGGSQGEAARELANKLGEPLSKGSGASHNMHTPPAAAPIETEASEQRPRVYAWGNAGPPPRADELRRHVYSSGEMAIRIKLKLNNGGFVNWYRVFDDGAPVGWQAKKPVDYQAIPYRTAALDPFDCELIADEILWPEGEKDVDILSKLNLPAFTFGGVGDGLPEGIGQHLKDRRLVILADNDDAGRIHAEKKAALAHDAGATCIKIVHFPELPPKGDVSDFLASASTTEQLLARIETVAVWAPRSQDQGGSPGTDNTNAPVDPVAIDLDADRQIRRLASLPPVAYEHERGAVAAQLGMRASALDAAVKAKRRAETTGQGRVVEMQATEPWPSTVNGASLLDDTVAAICRYVVMPLESAETLALWAIHTHCFACFIHTPRAAILSPEKGCGKTTTLDVLETLVSRPLPTSNASVSAIFRVIERDAPTLLIDEADTFLKENDELRGILNSGHRRGGQVMRTVGDDFEPRNFSTWAPAAIAMIGRLPDTLNDRSVIINLRRRKPTERVASFRRDRASDLVELTRKMARWSLDHQIELSASDPDMAELVNRVADNWRPLFAIADVAGGDWPTRVREIAGAAETAAKENRSTRYCSAIFSGFSTGVLVLAAVLQSTA